VFVCVFVCSFFEFLFMNSKRHKPMLQAEGGSGARVLFVLCGLSCLLPISCACALPPLYMVHTTIQGCVTVERSGACQQNEQVQYAMVSLLQVAEKCNRNFPVSISSKTRIT
jgi:hypothetical protein